MKVTKHKTLVDQLETSSNHIFFDFCGQGLLFSTNQSDHRVERIELYLDLSMRARGSTHRRILPGKSRILPLKYPRYPNGHSNR